MHTRRLHALGYAVIAEVALVGDLVFRVEKAHAVRAGHDAVAAADAPFAVHQHHPVFGLVGRPDRADLHAGRVVALVAEFRHEESFIDSVRIDLFAVDDALQQP